MTNIKFKVIEKVQDETGAIRYYLYQLKTDRKFLFLSLQDKWEVIYYSSGGGYDSQAEPKIYFPSRAAVDKRILEIKKKSNTFSSTREYIV